VEHETGQREWRAMFATIDLLSSVGGRLARRYQWMGVTNVGQSASGIQLFCEKLITQGIEQQNGNSRLAILFRPESLLNGDFVEKL